MNPIERLRKKFDAKFPGVHERAEAERAALNPDPVPWSDSWDDAVKEWKRLDPKGDFYSQIMPVSQCEPLETLVI